MTRACASACAAFAAFAAILGTSHALLEFHPRYLGLEALDAPLHLQLPSHMLSMNHERKKGSNEAADDRTFESASKSQSWRVSSLVLYRLACVLIARLGLR